MVWVSMLVLDSFMGSIKLIPLAPLRDYHISSKSDKHYVYRLFAFTLMETHLRGKTAILLIVRKLTGSYDFI